MGSIGSVAQSKNSDFDYWVVIEESKLSKEGLNALRKKLASIEKWADEKKVEVHFFLTDTEKTKNNYFGESDKESAGSSQALILKEEFYRTAILVSGKDPLWWILPAGLTDIEYEEHAERMYKEGEIKSTDVVDLGNIETISTGELFGALLWQFNKAISSPYKSALKMALLRNYIGSNSKNRLLCDVIKNAIHANPNKSDQADPYLLMFDSIRRHYVKAGRKDAAFCLEKCFFMKSLENPINSTADETAGSYKNRTLKACVKHWKWEKHTLSDVNNFRKWGHGKMGQLASEVHKFMLDTYIELKDDIDKQPNVKSLITNKDLTILGRKLFTIYDKKDKDKIEFVKRVMNENMELEAITFYPKYKMGRPAMWEIYGSDIVNMVAKRQSIDHFLIKKGTGIASLILWLVQNKIFYKGTLLYYISDKNVPVALKDLHELIQKTLALLPPVYVGDLDNQELIKSAYVKRIVVAVNFTTPRWNTEPEFIHILYTTSWGESFCHALPAKDGLLKLLDVLARTKPNFSTSNKIMFEIIAPKSENETKLVKKTRDYVLKNFKHIMRTSLSRI
jgi:adenylate cyclase class 1